MMKTAKVGTIMPWTGDGTQGFSISNLPIGWLLCDGTLHPADRYPLLASQIGDSYGGDDFDGDFPDYEGSFRVPNMTLKMPMDLEPFHLGQTKYQYGQIDAYEKLVSNTYTGNPLIGGYGLTYPIQTVISTATDIDFTIDPTLVMQGKMTNISIGDPSFSTTVYTLNRKLGINHTPGHGHPGTYSKVDPQFVAPMVFEPSRLTVGGEVTGECASKSYASCQLSNPNTAPIWQNGAAFITYYGSAQHEFTLPVTDRFYNFVGTSYWQNVPANSWPPPGPHPSGEVTSPDLSYQFAGSAFTSTFTVTNPNKEHQQPAWTGVFPKPITIANARNHYGPVSNYNPDTSVAHTISGVTLSATSTTITLPAGADIGTEFDKVVPFMWVYTTTNSLDISPGTQILSITRTSGTSTSNYVYTLELSQPTLNAAALSNVTLNFKHGTFPTTLNNLTSSLNPNGTSFIGHNHGSFEISMGTGSLAPPTTYPVNNISLGDVAPENINDALNIIADVTMPALVTTFIIKAY